MPIHNSKNLTPAKIALLNAAALSIIISLISILMLSNKWDVIWIAICTAIVSYLIFVNSLQFFIYRKIKLIYKLIMDTKASKKEEYFYEQIIADKSIDEVKDEVAKWANFKNIEIQNLKKNEQFRKEFLMNLAHELRTPIFTTQGYIHTLLNENIEDETTKRNFLNNAAIGIDRLAELTKDILLISKLESGESPLEYTSFIIQDLTKEVFQEFEMMAKKQNIKLSIKAGTEAPLNVYADKAKIQQVLINLISNAIKYTMQDAQVQAGFYVLDEEKILVEIADNGPGIKEELLPRIFERFFRVDKNRERNIGGTGLGLAIVKHTIESHGQTVFVRSKVGVGSTFGFTLARKK